MVAPPPSMVEDTALRSPMPVPEKLADAPAAAPAKKKPSSSSNDKKRKGKGPPDLALAAEAPVTKRKGKGLSHPVSTSEIPIAKIPKTGDVPTSTTELPRSGIAIAATHTTVQTLVTGCRPRGPRCPCSKMWTLTARRHSSDYRRMLQVYDPNVWSAPYVCYKCFYVGVVYVAITIHICCNCCICMLQ
ncbi:uncharacterized protein LOC110433283 [Sorghum bicolor]|uniref:uncharacterized protein LOC110433283 n=1 Tax=Sorghum bicolor TaxID=4558 RepID=UPI00081AE229|nr:uncharacterized protein LOC110433283 [Sorghum bicolor]|eukprot:XP_021310756.1 uncharacterized protein LOC110433283 [Sorghum bicolor]